jgi:hypothetical protein
MGKKDRGQWRMALFVEAKEKEKEKEEEVVMGEKGTRGSLSVAVIDSTFSATIIYKNAFNSLYNVWLPSQTAMRQGLVVNPNSWQVSKSVSV